MLVSFSSGSLVDLLRKSGVAVFCSGNHMLELNRGVVVHAAFPDRMLFKGATTAEYIDQTVM